MSYDTNNLTIVGRLTRDPESAFTQNNNQYTKFSIANNQGNADDPNSVNFFDVITWNKTAEVCAQYIKKGSQVVITGKLTQNRFQDKDGNNRSKVEIIGYSVQFVGGKSDNAGGQQQYDSRPFDSSQNHECDGDIPF